MAAGCKTQLNYIAENVGQYRVNVAASAGANSTVTASAANGTPALLVSAFILANAANSTVAGDVVIYDGAVGAGNIVFSSAGRNISSIDAITINAPLVNGCLTVNGQANCPALWFSYMGTGFAGT